MSDLFPWVGQRVTAVEHHALLTNPPQPGRTYVVVLNDGTRLVVDAAATDRANGTLRERVTPETPQHAFYGHILKPPPEAPAQKPPAPEPAPVVLTPLLDSFIPAWRCPYGSTAVSACRHPKGHDGYHDRRQCRSCQGMHVEGAPPACRACGAPYDEREERPGLER